LHAHDCEPEGFDWVDCADSAQSVLAWLRRAPSEGDTVLAIANFTPVARAGYRVGVPQGGRWDELLNSDARVYGGSGTGNLGGVEAEPLAWHGRPWSLNLTLPPLAVLLLRPAHGVAAMPEQDASVVAAPRPAPARRRGRRPS
jgi:1,4-alpha-glucan branching enzyme